MELIERPNMTAVHYLNSISYNDFKNDCINDAIENGEKKPVEKDMKTWYSVLKQFCKTNIKTKGTTKRIYSYSLKTENADFGGRLFCGGSLQGLWSVYRGLLMRGNGTDIDQANAHPVILRYICKKHSIPCANLEYYINNREECLNAFKTKNINRSQAKNMYLVSTNNDKFLRNGAIKTDHFKKYEKEMKEIQKILIEKEEYKGLFETIEDYKKEKNYNGCAINKILCFYENKILQHAIHIVNKRGIEIAILMFDGLMIYGDYYDNEDLLKEITEYVEKMMPTLNMKWAYKEHDNSLHIPEDFDEKEYEKDSNTNSDEIFKMLYPDFEKTHAKIKNRSCYIKELDSEVIVFSKSMLHNAYEHIECGFSKQGIPVKFIDRWTGFNNKIRIYDDMNIYPDTTKCPKTIFNLWKPFNIDLFKGDFIPNEDGAQKLLHHIKILCNHQEEVYDYIILWVAHMLQYPAKKSIIPTFISKQGAGKGTLLKILSRLIGANRVLETTSPSRDVWGNFNGMMPTKFLVNLNELSRKETIESEGRIKALITDPMLTINSKGINQYEVYSYHRFIITTNQEQPIATSDDDRRNLIIRSSDELLKNKDYFIELNKLIEDDAVIRTIGKIFKDMEVKENFNEYSIPHTKYQDDLKEESRPYHELWLYGFIAENHKENEVKLYPSEVFNLYTNWCNMNGYKIDNMNSTKLGVRLNNLFNPTDRDMYITTEQNGKRRKTFFIQNIKKHFNIIIDDNEPDYTGESDNEEEIEVEVL